jgi:hypothetical protein
LRRPAHTRRINIQLFSVLYKDYPRNQAL